jgi:hypothetical protein
MDGGGGHRRIRTTDSVHVSPFRSSSPLFLLPPRTSPSTSAPLLRSGYIPSRFGPPKARSGSWSSFRAGGRWRTSALAVGDNSGGLARVAVVAATGGPARLGPLDGLCRASRRISNWRTTGMVPVAMAVGVDMVVPRGDAVGVALATSMVGGTTCCTAASVVVVSAEPRFVVGRWQPRCLWAHVVGSHWGGGLRGVVAVARRLRGWKVSD